MQRDEHQHTGGQCSLPDGWAQIERRQARFIVFGELHGTSEAPQLVGSIVCAIASRNQRVLLAIEHDATDNVALQEAWNAPLSDFRGKLQDAGWEGRSDGVASEAMALMLSELHPLRENRRGIGVVAFNGFVDPAQKARFAHLPGQGAAEAAEAENIISAANAGDFDVVIVLVGTLHARRDTVEIGGARIAALAGQLSQAGATLGLEMRYAAGTSWNCTLRDDFDPAAGKPVTSGDVDCDNHPTTGNAQYGRSPFVHLYEAGQDPQRMHRFDGFFWVGPVTGSSPWIAE